jgi:hypothetical protein
MEKSFTQTDIDKFFSDFRNLSNPYKIEKVHQLLNNPNARARYRVKLNYKPFNFIIMTSAVIIGLSALIIWSNPKKVNINEISKFQKSEPSTEVVLDSDFSQRKTSDLNQSRIESPTIKTKAAPNSDVLTKVAVESGSTITKTIDLS